MNQDPGIAMTDDKPATGPYTLAIDVGGTGLKVGILDSRGGMIVPRVRIDTPYPFTPGVLIDSVADMVRDLPGFDRISLGFPGFVRDGKVLTAPEFGIEKWASFALADALTERFGTPARILNDAEVQGYGAISGKGLELVLTLGTGAGTALFRDGQLMPHMELAQHVIRKDKTYNEYVGDHVLKKIGRKRWSEHVLKTIQILHDLLLYDTLYLGGGNAGNVKNLPEDVIIVSNDLGLTGGVRLWTSG